MKESIVKVSIADENVLYCSRITASLSIAGIIVLNTCNTFRDFESLIDPRSLPDIVMLSRTMAGKETFGRLEWLKGNYPTVKVVIMVMFGHKDIIRVLKKQNIEAIVIKSTDPAQITNVLKHVKDGNVFFPEGR